MRGEEIKEMLGFVKMVGDRMILGAGMSIWKGDGVVTVIATYENTWHGLGLGGVYFGGVI